MPFAILKKNTYDAPAPTCHADDDDDDDDDDPTKKVLQYYSKFLESYLTGTPFMASSKKCWRPNP